MMLIIDATADVIVLWYEIQRVLNQTIRCMCISSDTTMH